MRTLHIVMPMAGRGSRFAKAGVITPKPLIPVDGKPMFMKALSSLDLIDAAKRYTIIIREEHDEQHDLAKQLREVLPEVNIVMTNEPATGALRDAYRAKPYLKLDEGVLIMDCDIWLHSQRYFQTIQDSLDGKLDIQGGLLLFKADNPRFSYAELDADGMVIRTAEKQVISPYAIAGGYYVGDAETLIKAADVELAKPLDEKRPEHFVSYMYNTILEQGGKVKGVVGEFISFGTPEELAAYNQGKK